MTRVAAIDCGTNSIRLLIADVEDGVLTDIVRTLEVVRLGEGVDRTGRFTDAALDRTLAATERYAELCREHGVLRVRFVATSATRDAANREEFMDRVRAVIGVAPEVISGEEEASLSFRGAASVLPWGENPRLVVDLGGGSTELVLGTDIPSAAYSMDVGCVRLTERNIRTDPPTTEELDGVRSEVSAALDTAAETVDLSLVTEVIGVAGTITTVTAHALRLPHYDSNAIHGIRLPLEVVLSACAELSSMPRAERAALPYMHPGRLDVIAAGAVVWAEVLTRTAIAAAEAGSVLDSVVTSEHDILDGVALSLADAAG